MKKSQIIAILIIIIVVLIVVVFLLIGNGKIALSPVVNNALDNNTASNIKNTKNENLVSNKSIVESTSESAGWAYINNQYNFYLDFPNVVVTDATSTTNGIQDSLKRFFAKDNNGKLLFDISITDEIYSDIEFNEVVYNNITFKHYVLIPIGGGPENYYEIEHNKKLYIIKTNDAKNLSYFGFIN